MNPRRLTLFVCLLLAAGCATAQPIKLAYLIPDLYGPQGLTLANPDHYAHFTSSVNANFTPFNSAMARQLTSLPLPSPASGFVYTFDRTLGVYTRSAKSLGPILAGRAETIGKDRFVAGIAYQHFSFSSIDGLDLHSVPVVFEHAPATNIDFQKDIITTQNFIDVGVRQVTAFLSYGLTNRLDVALAVPVLTVNMEVRSDATIQRVGTGSETDIHTFGTPGGGDKQTFIGRGRATGIGDTVARLNGTLVKWAGGGLAAQMDVRLPTGDEYNFLGSGAVGLRPLVIASTQVGSVSPHANFGYQWNGKSVLAGDVVARQKANLPRAWEYAAGVDIGATPKMTIALDLLGERVKTPRVVGRRYVAANGQTFPTIGFLQSAYDVMAGSVGVKINPVGRLVVTANTLFRLNHTGLRSKVVPLLGISYTL